jgi:hypothetical protein
MRIAAIETVCVVIYLVEIALRFMARDSTAAFFRDGIHGGLAPDAQAEEPAQQQWGGSGESVGPRRHADGSQL